MFDIIIIANTEYDYGNIYPNSLKNQYPLIKVATMLKANYQERITIEPGKRGGKPCIRGLRITVYDVLDYLAAGMSEDDIISDFPDLEKDDIRACLAFAADRGRNNPSHRIRP